eukprot:2798044-Pleurochrysis_carterae.AAC.1
MTVMQGLSIPFECVLLPQEAALRIKRRRSRQSARKYLNYVRSQIVDMYNIMIRSKGVLERRNKAEALACVVVFLGVVLKLLSITSHIIRPVGLAQYGRSSRQSLGSPEAVPLRSATPTSGIVKI